MRSNIKFILGIAALFMLIKCSSSIVINKGDGNEFETDVSSEPKTNVEIDSLKILNKDNNLKN